MGGVDCHENPPGYGHPIQCDTIEDVKAKGRLHMMHDVSLDVEAMEKMKLHLEKYSVQYKYYEELNKKHTR